MIRRDATCQYPLFLLPPSKLQMSKQLTSSTVSRISPDKNAVMAFATPRIDPAMLIQLPMCSSTH